MGEVVQQSHLFGTPLRRPPTDADSVSGKLLSQGGFIHQLAAGVFSLLPLGLRVHRRIEQIIREELTALGAVEVLLPSLHPKALWEETGRWATMDPPLFTVSDRHDRLYALAPTHEEVITDLARTYLNSYKQLPALVFQIQTKFRNEQRATSGLLRTREFAMNDLYSFHESEADLAATYERVKEVYRQIFRRCGLEAIPVPATSGSIGGTVSHEFVVLAGTGEDRVARCSACGFVAKAETLPAGTTRCPSCARALEFQPCIEAGHIFQLGQTYSEKMRARVTTARGTKRALVMGCYGIGLGRLLATVVETWHDGRGMIWPAGIAPFAVHLLEIGGSVGDRNARRQRATVLATELADAGFPVLYDDRVEASLGEKFADADLIGIPRRLVLSPQHMARGTVGVKGRTEKEERAVPREELRAILDAPVR